MDLAQKAFEVYCDLAVRDGVAHNQKLREENESLQAADALLRSVKLSHGGTVLKQCTLLEHSRETDTHLIFSVDPIDCRLEDHRSLDAEIGGVCCQLPVLNVDSPNLIVTENETIEIEFRFSQFVSASGTVQNQAGSIDQVDQMIRDNRHIMFLLGVEQILFHGANGETHELMGATFAITEVKVAKHMVQGILQVLDRTAGDGLFGNSPDDPVFEELELLSRVVPRRRNLRCVVTEHRSLQNYNSGLTLSRDTLETVKISFSSGNTITLNISEGVRIGAWAGVASYPLWLLVASPEDDPIPLSAVSNLSISVSGMPWSTPFGPLSHGGRPVEIGNDGTMMLVRYSDTVFACFTFDETLGAIDQGSIPGGVARYIDHTLLITMNPPSTRVSDYNGPEPYMTVRLSHILFGQHMIQRVLNVLRVNNEDEEGSAE